MHRPSIHTLLTRRINLPCNTEMTHTQPRYILGKYTIQGLPNTAIDRSYVTYSTIQLVTLTQYLPHLPSRTKATLYVGH